MAISIIVALSVQFNRKMRDHLTSAANVDHGLKALYAAKSGISYALALLAEDQRRDDKRVDTLKDVWAPESEGLKAINAASANLFDFGRFEVQIEDLSSKIQINQLVDRTNEKGKKPGGNKKQPVDTEELSKVFRRLLGNEDFGLDEQRIEEIYYSTRDWIDSGDDDPVRGMGAGAEEDDYLSRNPPYHCKNGPFDSVEELLLVKGMTRDTDTPDEESKPRDILPYLTVFGDGRINVNTADAKILASLHEEMMQEYVSNMTEHREQIEDVWSLEKEAWIYDFAGVPTEFKKTMSKIITTQSTHFKIIATGHYGDMSQKKKRSSITRTITAVFKRASDDSAKNDFELLSWKID